MRNTIRKISAIFFPSVCINTGPIGEMTSFHVGGWGGVTSITEHQAKYAGDKWYYDVKFSDGHVERVFNFNLIVFEK